MTMTGGLTRKAYYKRSASGAVSMAGDATGIRGLVQVVVAGVLSAAGALTRKVYFKRSNSGAITSAGTGAISTITESVSAVLSAAGALARKVYYRRSVDGSISSSGSGYKTAVIWHRTTSGILSFTANVASSATAVIKRGLQRFGMWMTNR